MLNEENLKDSWKELNRKSVPGVDKQTVKEYEENLEANIKDLNERLKRKAYHAKLVKRIYIPKANGKMRPLRLPATEDKLLQVCAARILNAIYEQDFLKCSYGYRMNIGARDAIKDVTTALQFGKYEYVVEADIKGFFDNIKPGSLKCWKKELTTTPLFGLSRNG